MSAIATLANIMERWKDAHPSGKVLVDVDSGVTPFMIRCRANFPSTCDGDMESAFYRVSQDLIPQYGWFRNPDGGEQLTLRRLDAVQREKYGERLRRG